MTTQVTLTIDGPIAHVRLIDEKGIQILSAETRRRLLNVVEEVATTDTSVVVFASEGRTFIAGANIDELRALNEQTALADSRFGQRLMNAIDVLPQTTVAAIHAACAGGGTELALACDLRFAAAGAKIGLPETSIGILPGWGGTVRATHLLGVAVARRLILTGELIGAEEARNCGLVDAVFPVEQFREEVAMRISQILSRAPNARRRVKHLLQQHAADGIDIVAQLDAEARAFSECYRTSEPHEGQTAFLQKRTPAW